MIVTQDDMIILVKHAQAGNIEAFDILMQNYEREIFRYLVGQLGDRDEALDFVQQVFLKAWLNLASLKDPACFKAWLHRIARNLMLDHWRCKKTCYQSCENIESDKTSNGLPGPEDCAEKAELISQALAQVLPKYRQCLLLKVVGGFLDYEIAEKVGISETSIATYICSARKQFRVAYQRLVDEHQN
jgi:RNA polymerase sigma-70 factor (ECF subfamily)